MKKIGVLYIDLKVFEVCFLYLNHFITFSQSNSMIRICYTYEHSFQISYIVGQGGKYYYLYKCHEVVPTMHVWICKRQSPLVCICVSLMPKKMHTSNSFGK